MSNLIRPKQVIVGLISTNQVSRGLICADHAEGGYLRHISKPIGPDLKGLALVFL